MGLKYRNPETEEVLTRKSTLRRLRINVDVTGQNGKELVVVASPKRETTITSMRGGFVIAGQRVHDHVSALGIAEHVVGAK